MLAPLARFYHIDIMLKNMLDYVIMRSRLIQYVLGMQLCIPSHLKVPIIIDTDSYIYVMQII